MCDTNRFLKLFDELQRKIGLDPENYDYHNCRASLEHFISINSKAFSKYENSIKEIHKLYFLMKKYLVRYDSTNSKMILELAVPSQWTITSLEGLLYELNKKPNKDPFPNEPSKHSPPKPNHQRFITMGRNAPIGGQSDKSGQSDKRGRFGGGEGYTRRKGKIGMRIVRLDQR